MKSFRKIGYLRVSTDHQDGLGQQHALEEEGCVEIFRDEISGAKRKRPGLDRMLMELRAGDTVVVQRSDRLARSQKHFLGLLEEFEERGIKLHSLSEPFYDGSPISKLIIQMLTAFAEFERNLASERSKAGQIAARANGREPGNPALKAGDPDMKRKIASARDEAHLAKIIAGMDDWWPIVQQMRPARSWEDTVRVLKVRRPDDKWNVDRLKRQVRKLASNGIVDKNVLQRTPRKQKNEHLIAIVCGLKINNPDVTLWSIAKTLEDIGERTAQGNTKWQASQVRSLLEQGRRKGIGQVQG